MAIATVADITPKTTLRKDLTDQQVTRIEKALRFGIKDNEFFDQFCEHRDWAVGADTMSYRKLVTPKLKATDVVPAVENKAPRSLKLEYTTYKVAVKNYRTKVKYTREEALYNIDDVVASAETALESYSVQELDLIKGKAFVSSKAIITKGATLKATFNKARIQLAKLKRKPWKNGKYLALVSYETLEAIENELATVGQALDEDTKYEINNAELKSKWGFYIVPTASEVMFHTNGTDHVIVFLGLNEEGKFPVTTHSMKAVEVLHKPLGTGLLEDVDGRLTSDDNNQQGAVALNIDGLACDINDDLACLNCLWTVATQAPIALAETAKTNAVSTSASPK